ncbi:NACHT domain-containing protein [Paenibacillus silvisoli]|uniref:hypothetical protein n=1 Tax=Paenibacillus silvisoli TaxID=3110539 RepID=UPI002803BE3E|nr:hypothetical protein [Paenibacillus silvisoli]
MHQINWWNIRSYNNSQNNAFEELVCQLARDEEIPNMSSFIRVGAPDGGVEAYCKLSSGEEYGWQAKFFNSMGDSQWKQIEDSFKTAFKKHPKLRKYYICLPLDRQDPRVHNQKWFMDKWNSHVEGWKKYALENKREIDFEYWGSSELLAKLSQEKNAGRYRFWFNSDLLSEKWFKEKLQLSIDSLGNRYTPKLNFDLEIAKTFDGITRDESLNNQLNIVYFQYQNKLKNALNSLRIKETLHFQSEIIKISTEMDKFYLNINFQEMNTINFEFLEQRCDQVSELLQAGIDKYYEMQQEEKAQRGTESRKYDNNKYNSEIYYIRQVQNTLNRLQIFLKSSTIFLVNNPVMILRGEAGIGKSHLLADIAQKRNSSGQPSILLLGQHFADDQNPWTQILRNQLRLDMSEDEFLGALDSKAQSEGCRILLIIDAVNEGRGRFFWSDHIKGFIRTVKKYKWIGLVLSIRTSYESLIFPQDIVTKDIAVRVTHHGFTDVEYEASVLFFDNYKIQQPSIPLLHPEFQNPLFLKLFCEGLYRSGLKAIPDGFEGISTILEFYITSINKKLSEPSRFNYSPHINLVKKAIYTLVSAKLDKNTHYIDLEEANQLVAGLAKDHTEKWRHFLTELLNEGILTQNLFCKNKNDFINGVYFAYERFDDHLTISFLLERYLDIENPQESFIEDKLLYSFIKDEITCYTNKGYIEALSIQLPEIAGIELFEAAPSCASFEPVIEAFINSLIWRKTQTINEKIVPFINEYVLNNERTYEQFWDTCLQVSSNPNHFFNAYKLHNHLMKFSLAERDSEWTVYINSNYSRHSSIKRIIDWAWTSEDRSYISNESITLSSITIAWFLTSSNRKLRDHATKALVCLLRNRVEELINWSP